MTEHLSTTNHKNLLPYDGEVYLIKSAIIDNLADDFFKQLLEGINWQSESLTIYGKTITTKRKVAWYGRKPFQYTYSASTKVALKWLTLFDDILKIITQQFSFQSNSCLLNLYHTGLEGMSWHSDDEPSLEKNAPILSISFGAERDFMFKHKKTKHKIKLPLSHGSALLMAGTTQSHWQHSLPIRKRVTERRINLTFRTMREDTLYKI